MQGSRETFAEKCRMQLFALQRENKINTSDTFVLQIHFNWFRLDSDGAHTMHKCTQ